MKRCTSIFFPVLVFLVVISGCAIQSERPASEVGASPVAQEIKIAIEADHRILLEGQHVTLETLEVRLLEKVAGAPVTFIISVAPEVPMGLLGDVRQHIPVGHLTEIRSLLLKS